MIGELFIRSSVYFPLITIPSNITNAPTILASHNFIYFKFPINIRTCISCYSYYTYIYYCIAGISIFFFNFNPSNLIFVYEHYMCF